MMLAMVDESAPLVVMVVSVMAGEKQVTIAYGPRWHRRGWRLEKTLPYSKRTKKVDVSKRQPGYDSFHSPRRQANNTTKYPDIYATYPDYEGEELYHPSAKASRNFAVGMYGFGLS
jgi:hypothetical protein